VSFAPLGLEPELLRAVADQGYTEPTPVQTQAIPLVLEGRDLLAGAQTGTGKTAAFVLPILQILNGRPIAGAPFTAQGDPRERGRRDGFRPPIRSLILTPTRELAIQIEQSVRTYGAQRPIRTAAIYGGVGFDAQVRALRAGAQIVVATPGRLLDHVGQGTIDLSRVEILVLDEADRMLDMGFIRDIRKILALLPSRRQNLLFSATFSDEIRRLADGILDRPAQVQVSPRNTTVELVRQVVHPVDRERKRELLSHLIRSGRIDQALVFTRTKHGANRLAEQLERDGIAATAIHGNKSQPQRNRALADFKAGRAAILVATDIAARGIDIDALPHVVNFELPMAPEDYVHRIGRTARAGMDGDAVSLVCVDEQKLLWQIETLLRTKIEIEVVEGFEPDRSIRPQPIVLRSAVGRGGGAATRSGRPAPSNRSGYAPAHRPVHSASAGPREVTAGPRHGGAGRPAQVRRPGQSIGAYAPAARPNGRPARPGPARPNGQGTPRGSHQTYPNQGPGGPRPITSMPGERLARAAAPRNEGNSGRRPDDRQR
jgi:ATP-dependent RNA helicase RhlE